MHFDQELDYYKEYFDEILQAKLFANSGDPDQRLRTDLGMHCLPVTLLGVSRLQWVN